MLEQVFDCSLDDKESTMKNGDLPTDEVRKSEKFSALKCVNSDYFPFVLRIEFVFVKLLTKNNFVILGNTFILTIYDEIVLHNFVYRKILAFIIDEFCFEAINNFILFIVQTYCLVWGKYFIQKYT